VSKTFRKNAHHCFTLAYETKSLASHVRWMEMGRLWSNLARRAEEECPAVALFHDAAQIWVALASQLGERMEAPTMMGRQRQHAAMN
jgi:hypothetical protein